MPVGFAAERRGAVAAAVAYSTASQRWLYFTDDEVKAAIAEIATPVAAPRMAEDVVGDVSMARDQLAQSSGRIWWLVRPLAWRVESFRDTEARVSVWTITILSAAGVAAPQSEYLTVTLDLAWVDGDWRVDGVRDTQRRASPSRDGGPVRARVVPAADPSKTGLRCVCDPHCATRTRDVLASSPFQVVDRRRPSDRGQWRNRQGDARAFGTG